MKKKANNIFFLTELVEKKSNSRFFSMIKIISMLFRITTIRNFLFITIIFIIIHQLIVYLFNDTLVVKENLVLPNSLVYNEFIQLQFPFLRFVNKIN